MAEYDVEARPPTDRTLNRIQARRLAALTGVPAAELADRTIAELADELRWRVDPRWFLFERVCGRVVKVDPGTGLKYPVPGATVDVLDVDCDWLWFFPVGWPWSWVYPWGFCEIETLATTTTDACGNFCVWIPLFDIDWVLRWRRERICFPDLLRRPSIEDLLRHVHGDVAVERPFPPNPNPPDPAPLISVLSDRPDVVSAIGAGTAARLQAAAVASQGVGASARGLRGLLAGPAFSQPVPPPLDAQLRRLHERGGHAELAERMSLDAARVEKLDLARWHGPYLRCFDVFVPEWFPVLDVPDITIQVTQDTDADGDQEVIYDHAFGVPWSIPTPDLELDAAPFALALPSPGCGPDIACTDTPAIQTVGLMPIDPGFVEGTHGFATRPNRSRPLGHFTDPPTYPSTTPFAGTLQLYGCAAVAGADRYRILSEYAPGDGLSGLPAFGAQQPLKEQWHVYRFGPFVDLLQQPDPDGWYPILDDTWWPQHLLMNWNPGAMGSYRLTLEAGHAAGGGVAVVASAAPVVLYVDDSSPTVWWNLLQWRYQGDVGWTTLPFVCPLIARDPTRAVEVQVGITASAPHLRQVVVQAGGCGGASPAPSLVEHWHTSEVDNAWTDATIYTIPAHAAPGCYGWTVVASSRAFSPAGDDDGLAVDWWYDPMRIYVTPSLSVAVVDA